MGESTHGPCPYRGVKQGDTRQPTASEAAAANERSVLIVAPPSDHSANASPRRHSGRVSRQTRTTRNNSSATHAEPITHQLAGSSSYSVKPGVSEAWRAAATGSIVSTAWTVAWPNGASRPSQTSSGPTQTARSATYEAVVVAALERNNVLIAALSRTANTAVNSKQTITRCTWPISVGLMVIMAT